MTFPLQHRRGCSPWTLLGCGCGLVAGLGILLVFFILGMQQMHARKDPTWNREAYAQCQENLGYLKRAIASYESDHHRLPASLNELRGSYLDRPSRLRCPLEVQEIGGKYIYTPEAKNPTDALITCPNHGHGPIVLQRNGYLRLPKIFSKK